MTTHEQLIGGEVGGVSPWDLCRKLALLPEGAARRAAWFAQSFGAEPGDFVRLAGLLAAAFPGRYQGGQGGVVSLALRLRELCEARACRWPGTVPAGESGFASPVWEFGSPDFQDLAGALGEFMDRHAAAVRRGFYLTNIGRAVWGTLDAWLSERGGAVIEGDTGRGKSAAVKTWCEARRGEARLVCLRGFGDGRSVFRAVAKALGLAVNYSVLPRALRDRVTDCLAESGLGLVIDEAHYLLPEPGRRGRPEMVDWLNAGLREAGVPVALVTTPQFAPRLADLQRREGWNVGQFRRRFAGHWLTLDAATSEKDLAELAGRLLPMVEDRGLKLCVDYARGWRDVSGLIDLVTAARKRAEAGGRAQPILEDLLSALRGDRLPTERAMEAAFARSMSGEPARQPATIATPQTGRGASAMAVQPARRVSPVEALPVPQ